MEKDKKYGKSQQIGKLELAVKAYMDEFRLKRVFFYWLARVYTAKERENKVVWAVVKRSMDMRRKCFGSIKDWTCRKVERDKKFGDLEKLILVERELRRKALVWKKWVEGMLARTRIKKGVVDEWRKVVMFEKRRRKIEALKAEVVDKGLKEGMKKACFEKWRRLMAVRREIKVAVVCAWKRQAWICRKVREMNGRRRERRSEKVALEKGFVGWMELSRKNKVSRGFWIKNRKVWVLQALNENSKKAFMKRLFIEKYKNFYDDNIKRKFFSLLKSYQITSSGKKFKINQSQDFYNGKIMLKYFNTICTFHANLKTKFQNLKLSIHFWKETRLRSITNSLKSYYLIRKQKKSNLKKAKQLRIFDLQRETIIKWIDTSMHLKSQSDQIETTNSIQKQEKIYKLVQKFVSILKSRIRPRVQTPCTYLPKAQLILEPPAEYEPRKRPEPRRLVSTN